MFERGEYEINIGPAGLRPRHFQSLKPRGFTSSQRQRASKFAVATVKDQHARAIAKAQHIGEIIYLFGQQGGGAAERQIGVDEHPWG